MNEVSIGSLRWMLAASVWLGCVWGQADEPSAPPSQETRESVSETEPTVEIRQAISRSLPLLEKASAGSADKRSCFTCHSQAMPVLALAEAQRHSFEVDQDNFRRQLDHTHRHLKRGTKAYLSGKGQGGGVDTAGYALWTLEDGLRERDEVTQPVVDWLLEKQQPQGHWKCSSKRPPSEVSHFTTTYLAVRGLANFSSPDQSEKVAAANQNALEWLGSTEAKELEDHVFRLLTLEFLDEDPAQTQSAVNTLMDQQRSDGGWSQTTQMQSDAYATATAMYALHRAGVTTQHPAWQRGIRYLLENQHDDGSWHVVSRSKPFQKYFETGFPHGTDQFISTTATAWATIALLLSLPPAP